MFTVLMDSMKGEILHNLFRSTSNLEAFGAFLQSLPQFLIHADETGAQQTEASGSGGTATLAPPRRATATALEDEPESSLDAALSRSHAPAVRDMSKVGRNDPCPCGSGKKYKNCCGRLA